MKKQFLIFALLAYNLSKGQKIKQYAIEEVEKTTKRSVLFSTGKATQKINKLTLETYYHKNIGNLLSENSSLNISSYGSAGAMNSVSIRGFGTQHSKLMWNGINLNSITTGGSDLALLPSFLFNDIHLFIGGGGSIFGSGSFGGTIELDNKPDFSNQINAKAFSSWGSFHDQQYGLKLNIGNKTIQYGISAFYHQTKNDFPYKDTQTFGSPEVKQTHNTLEEKGTIQSIHLKLRNKLHISLNTWYQFRTYEIPKKMGSAEESAENQRDSSLRLSISLEKLFSESKLSINAGYDYNYLLYKDRNLESLTNPKSYIGNINHRVYLKLLIFDYGIEYKFMDVTSSNFSISPEYDLSFFKAIKIKKGAFCGSLSLRKVFNSHKNSPLLFSIGAEYSPLKEIKFRLSSSSKYRRPTFNEKYWPNAGNTDLVPETGKDLEGGIDIFFAKQSNYSFHYSLTTYIAKIYDYIKWQPDKENSSIWKPKAYKDILSKGIENQVSYIQKITNSLKLNYKASYSFNKVYSNNIFIAGNEDITGKQLPYSPKHIFSHQLKILVKKHIYTTLSHNYRGKVFISDDHSLLPLKSFSLFHFSQGINIHHKNFITNLSFQIQNIFNKSYMIRKFYAMPGRSYHINTILTFNK